MLNNQKGMALIIVFIMTTVIVLIGGAALSLGSTVRKNAVMEVHQSRAYYAAEAGVEKALAEAKHNYAWLKTTVPLKPGGFYPADDEKCLFSDNSHYPDAGDESVIESLRVIKTAEDLKNNTVDLKIQSTGRSFQSRKTITVDARVIYAYPELFFRGIWTDEMSTLPKGHGVNFQVSTSVSTEGITIPNDSTITGDVFCDGSAFFVGNPTNFTEMTGDIYANGNVDIGEGTQITGDIYATGSVTLGDNTQLTGNIYVVNPAAVPGYVTCADSATFNGIIKTLDTAYFDSKMPPDIPDPLTAERLEWYKSNANYFALPAKVSDTFTFQNGVYYIAPPPDVLPENFTLLLEGLYTGQATVIVNGRVNINNNLTRIKKLDDPMDPDDLVDCLTILATGIIETQTATTQVESYLYSSTGLDIKNKTELTGGVITSRIAEAPGSIIHIMENPLMLEAYKATLTDTTNFIKIVKWINN